MVTMREFFEIFCAMIAACAGVSVFVFAAFSIFVIGASILGFSPPKAMTVQECLTQKGEAILDRYGSIQECRIGK
jgi:low affinity Fe/Cu permease